MTLKARDRALVELGERLRARDYQFVTPTPETHRRVSVRAHAQGGAQARDLRDVFGWSRPFDASLLPSTWLSLLETAGELHHVAGLLRAGVRFSTLGKLLLVHSAYPTTAPDAVFFGPDTYRFCALLARWAPRARQLVDIGCGTGAGALVLRERAEQLVLCDVNPRALRYARVSAELARCEVTLQHSDVLRDVAGTPDLIIANPPYMLDAAGRAYRDGGGLVGEGLSVRIVRESLARLAPGGSLIVYTGAACIGGHDSFLSAVRPVLREAGLAFDYEELDPDVFGEELDQPGYEQVERIAAVALRVQRGGEAGTHRSS
jgi:methylase of polypeptide subunit release factors